MSIPILANLAPVPLSATNHSTQPIHASLSTQEIPVSTHVSSPPIV